MSKEFTKKEVIALFEKQVVCKKTLYFECENIKFPLVKAGAIAQVCLIENLSGSLTVSLLIDDDLQAFDKTMFDYHLELVEPCFINAGE